MSRMTLKVLDRDGDVSTAQEFNNAWLFQPFVWDTLCDKAGFEGPGHMLRNWEKLWKWAGDGEPLDWFEWNTLVFGYDHVLVAKSDLPLLVESLRAFHAKYGVSLPHNHCLELAQAIESRVDDIEGVAIWGTSVTDDLWSIYNEDTDESRTYNINVDTKHQFATLKQP